MKNYYLKYQIKYQTIFDVLNKLKKRRINFFIDLQNIARGLYNKDVILMELGRYATEGQISNIFIDELKQFINNLFLRYKQYDPYFVLFFDDGQCLQNKILMSNYKGGRKSNYMVEDEELELFRKIKKYYFNEMYKIFNTKPDIAKAFYLNKYESDFIPYYCITKGLYDSSDNDVLNVILSVDKDLLQCCEFINTIQCATTFHGSQKGSKQIHFGIYDNMNSISYIYNKFKPGILTAKFIPLILAISGDKADDVPGIKGIGPAKACKIIENNKLPFELNKNDIKIYPEIIQENFELIQLNYKVISFKEQIKRIPEREVC